MRYEDGNYLKLTDGDLVFDVAYWQMHAENAVNFVGGTTQNEKTKQGGGGRDWVINGDGTVSAKHQQHLVLGLRLPEQPVAKSVETGGGGHSLDGSYISFKTGGSPDAVVDRFEAKTSNNGRRIDYYRNGNKNEGYDINGKHMTGPVSADIHPNGDIVYSHGYTSRKAGGGGGGGGGGGVSRPPINASLNGPLNDACRNTNDTARIRQLVRDGADLTSTNGQPWDHTGLHQASYHNRPEVVRVVIELARGQGLLKQLLAMGSNPCGRGGSGRPIELASPHPQVQQILREAEQGGGSGGQPNKIADVDANDNMERGGGGGGGGNTDLSGDWYTYIRGGDESNGIDNYTFEKVSEIHTCTSFRGWPSGPLLTRGYTSHSL